MTYDLRTHLKVLGDHGLLRRVRREVDKNWNLSAIMRWVYMGNEEAKRYAVLFEQVKGYVRFNCRKAKNELWQALFELDLIEGGE